MESEVMIGQLGQGYAWLGLGAIYAIALLIAVLVASARSNKDE